MGSEMCIRDRIGVPSNPMGSKKCDFYLRGLPNFRILTDHRPLVGLFNKSLHQLENTRLMRMREKLTNYTFQVEWVEGKSHLIADALSRAPVFSAEEFAMQADTAILCLQAKSSESLSDIGLKRDDEYLALLAAIGSGRDFADLPPSHLARRYKSCLLYTSPSPRDLSTSRMPSSA